MIESTPPIMKAGDATLMLGEKTTRLMRMSTGTIQANAISSQKRVSSIDTVPSDQHHENQTDEGSDRFRHTRIDRLDSEQEDHPVDRDVGARDQQDQPDQSEDHCAFLRLQHHRVAPLARWEE